ncbi:FecCD family ABC transporter permease [Paenibacillus macerans]|uniref:FecCD family ABC transporter permease n=1 Tax=Paenibacillus macerans TaxID=44252 RepID=UPI000EE1A549|nr:iron ABC transporter permease [Paenibacillus macerans]GBK64868.1 iron ABC transporter permease [Paenibacillus macerans]GBK71160.1 iron ABC transporter permease [Paenibacillus macerans]
MGRLKQTKRKYVLLILAPAVLLMLIAYGLSYGSVPVPLSSVWQALTSESTAQYETIIVNLRLPRVLIAMLVGACLAAAGSLLQGVMKNPLADPGIIGVTSGGGIAAIAGMLIFPEWSYMLPLIAFAGALITSLAVYLLSWDNGTSPFKIILAGVAVNALLGAAMNAVMVMYSDRVQAVLPWLAGGLSGRSWSHLLFMLPYAAAGLLLSILAIKPANLLLLGDDASRLLGQRVELHRFVLIALSSLLAGAAVSVAGLVGFVGLVVPHAVRMLAGEDYRFLLPLSILWGAALVLFADIAARSWFDPIELPVGVLLAGLGAPFFLFLLKKRRMM